MTSYTRVVARGLRLAVILALVLSVVPIDMAAAHPAGKTQGTPSIRSVVAAPTAADRVEALRQARVDQSLQSAPQAPTAVGISATKRDALLVDVDGDTRADPGDTLEYTVVISNSGSDDATSVQLTDTLDANTTITGSLAASPVAVNDVFPVTVVGNVSIDSAALVTPFSVTANDYLGLNPPVGTTISAYGATTAQGGQVVLTPSGANMGKFTYNPPPGFEGTDTFTYTLSDNTAASSAAINRTSTVSITVSGMVWFINNNAAACTTLVGGCGRLSNPFSSLAAFNALNNGTGNNPAANDNIFIYESGTGYSGAVTLLSGQKLIGQDATASLSTITGLTPPTGSPAFPAMNSANGTFTNLVSTVTLNTSTTVRGLQINSTTSTGLTDPAAAISGVSVSDISIATTTGTAVSLSGAGGTFTFRSISANGAANGISLANTTGSFNVNGDGTDTTLGGNNSGGVIQNTIGADGASAGNGVYLSSAQNVTLRRMHITNNQNFAISGATVSGFTLEYSTVDGTNGNNPITSDEGSVAFTELTGVVAVTGTRISGGIEDNFRIRNTGGSLNRITFNAVNIGANSTADGNAGVLLDASGSATLNVTVQSSTFTSSRGDLFHLNLSGNATSDLIFHNNALSNNHPAIATGGGGVTIGAGNNTGSVNLTFIIDNNTFRDAVGHAVLIFKSTDPGTVQGTFSNNTIGVAASANSGSAEGDGLKVQNAGGGAVTVAVTNNQIHQYNVFGIELLTGGGATAQSGNFNATVTGNLIDTPGNTAGTIGLPKNGIHLNGGTVPADTYAICAQIGGAGALANSISTSGKDAVPPTLGDLDFRLRQRQTTTVRLPGYGGANNDNTAVQNFFIANNSGNGAPVGLAQNTVATGGGGFVGGAACAQPITLLTSDRELVKSDQGVDSVAAISGGNSKPLFNPRFDPAFVPQTDRAVVINRVEDAITPVTVGTLPAGKSVTIKFYAMINNPVPAGVLQVSNQGTVSGSNFANVLTDDPDTGTANDPTVTPLDIAIDLQVTKSVNPTTAYPGLPITYTITYLNAGPQASTNVVITDPLPSALTGVAYQSSGTITSTGSSSWIIGTLVNGQSGTITVTGLISSALAVPTTITNTATITGTGRDTNGSNNTASVGLPINDLPISGLNAINSSPTLLGSATAFTATVGAGTNVVYQWNFGDGANGSGANTSHTYTAIGTYTATVTATNSTNFQVATTVVTVVDVPISGLNATNDGPTRLGNATNFNVTISAGSNVGYAWDFGDGATGSGATPAHTYTALGTYTATVTATNSTNQQVATTIVTVIDQPISGLTATNDSPTQVGSATHFTATISGGSNVTYQWNFGDGSAASGANASHTYGAVGPYVATITATNGVSVVVATTNVSIVDVPIVGLTAANSSPTIFGSPTAFTATIGGGTNVTYQWNFGDGALGSGATASHTYGAIGTYTATVTATNGSNTQMATTVATIFDTPITGLSATGDSPTRLGNATNFTATTTGGSGINYAWDFGDGVTGSGAQPSHTYAGLGTYTATVTATNTLNTQAASTVVVVIDQPIEGLSAANDSPTRLGSVTTFTATISNGTNVTYQWDFGDGATGSGAADSHTYGAVGSYVATVTATNGVSVGVATTNVLIIDTPIINLAAANDSPTRLGSVTNFTATINGGSNVTYQWNFGDGATGSGATAAHTYGTVGAYVATVTATNGVSVVVATTNVSIIDRAIVGLTATNSSPTGLGNSTAFTATISDGTNVVYAWNFGDGTLGSGAHASHTYGAVGAYTATVAATNGVSVAVASTVATVVNQPISGLSAANDSPTRLGSVTAFTATIATGSNVAYEWNFGDGATGSGANTTHAYAAIGTYTATVTATNSLNSQTASTVVVVIDRAIVDLTAANDSPTRLGSTTSFTATIGDGSNVTYAWNFGDGSPGSGATSSHTYAAVGAYVATVTATNGVSVVVATTNVSIIDTPIVNLAAANSSPTGLNLSTFLTVTIDSGSNVDYQWNFGDGATGSGAATPHVYLALGVYTATVTATNGVSNVVATTLVTIVDQPITTLIATSSSPTLLGSTSLFTATADGTSVIYTWDFGDGATGNGAHPAHTYAATGLYTAIVTATNGTSTLTATTRVNVFSGKVYLPLIARNYVAAPDLVVTSLAAATGSVQVVIKNQGDLPATDGFYVDVYINPNPVPTAVNQIWSDGRSAQGLTWGVTSSVQPGQVLTLTIGDAYYLPEYSVFTGTLPLGTPVYAQVDSFDPVTTYGTVRENHEIIGALYNNILGPVLSAAAFTAEAGSLAPHIGKYWLPVRLKAQ